MCGCVVLVVCGVHVLVLGCVEVLRLRTTLNSDTPSLCPFLSPHLLFVSLYVSFPPSLPPSSSSLSYPARDIPEKPHEKTCYVLFPAHKNPEKNTKPPPPRKQARNQSIATQSINQDQDLTLYKKKNTTTFLAFALADHRVVDASPNTTI